MEYCRLQNAKYVRCTKVVCKAKDEQQTGSLQNGSVLSLPKSVLWFYPADDPTSHSHLFTPPFSQEVGERIKKDKVERMS